jgi:hypothetical protein
LLLEAVRHQQAKTAGLSNGASHYDIQPLLKMSSIALPLSATTITTDRGQQCIFQWKQVFVSGLLYHTDFMRRPLRHYRHPLRLTELCHRSCCALVQKPPFMIHESQNVSITPPEVL